ncbi:MAG: hypothetical protein HC837_10295 [Chloroflexaceae bacterium]|nr:hypothetical protein [Chloroflexaceae bacterium]
MLTLGEIVLEDTVVISATGETRPVIDGNGRNRIFTIEGNYERGNTHITLSHIVCKTAMPETRATAIWVVPFSILPTSRWIRLKCVITLPKKAVRSITTVQMISLGCIWPVHLSIITQQAARGGGLYLRGHASLLSGSDDTNSTSVEHNTATQGGGIYLFSDAEVTLAGNADNLLVIGYNEASESGGGIYNNGTVTLNGAKIEHNTVFHFHGGGIFNDQGNLTISNSDISVNKAFTPFTDTWNGHQTISNYWGTGGGIANFNGGNVTITDTTIQTNTALLEGGGITNKGNGHMLLERVTLRSNEVLGAWLQYYDPADKTPEVYGNGAALFSQSSGQTRIAQSHIISNTAGHAGGAIDNTARLEIDDTLIEYNTAGKHPQSKGGIGGAMLNYTGYTLIQRSVFRYNTASDSGGAIFNLSAMMRIYESTFVANNAGNQGGAFYNAAVPRTNQWYDRYYWWPASIVEMTSVTMSGNEAGWRGGAILQNNENEPGNQWSGPQWNINNAIRLTNVTIADNRAYEYGGIAHVFSGNRDVWDNGGWDDSWIRNSIIADNLHRFVADNPDLPGSVTLQCASAGFPTEQPFRSRGANIASDDSCATWLTESSDRSDTDPRLGSLETQVGPDRDRFTLVYPLQEHSPAINPASVNGAPDTDQRGVFRINTRDIGAFESEWLTSTLPLDEDPDPEDSDAEPIPDDPDDPYEKPGLEPSPPEAKTYLPLIAHQ